MEKQTSGKKKFDKEIRKKKDFFEAADTHAAMRINQHEHIFSKTQEVWSCVQACEDVLGAPMAVRTAELGCEAALSGPCPAISCNQNYSSHRSVAAVRFLPLLGSFPHRISTGVARKKKCSGVSPAHAPLRNAAASGVSQATLASWSVAFSAWFSDFSNNCRSERDLIGETFFVLQLVVVFQWRSPFEFFFTLLVHQFQASWINESLDDRIFPDANFLFAFWYIRRFQFQRNQWASVRFLEWTNIKIS